MTTAFVLALLLAADAPAGAAPVAVETAAPQPEGEKQICRRVPELGSRIRATRVCMTRRQWAEQRRQNQQMIDRAQMRTGSCGAGGGC